MAIFKLTSSIDVRGSSSNYKDTYRKYNGSLIAYSLYLCIIMFPFYLLFKGVNFVTFDLRHGPGYAGYVNISMSIVICIGILSYIYIRQRYNYWSKLGVPCSKPALVVGHTLRRFGITMPIFQFYDEIYHNFGGQDFSGFYDFLKPGLIIGDLQLIKSILVEDFDYFANRRTLPLQKVNPIANEMLSNATGENWKRIRTTISPAFTSMKLRQLYPLICKRGDSFVILFNNSSEIKIQDVSGRFTLETIASCAFGIECDALNSDATQFPIMAGKIFEFSPIRALKFITLLTVPYLAELVEIMGYDFTSEEFHFFRHVVAKTLRVREEEGIRRGDFLDLMKDTKNLSETTMAAQAILFLLAGYDNIANTLSFALHLLATHPDSQYRLLEELQNCSTSDGDIDYETLIKLPFLDSVVNETLRLYPASPVTERICTKDYVIPGTKIPIKKGQPLIIPIWSIHRDPKHWPEAELFKPERFLNASSQTCLKAFMPFGAGPRQCIGMKFATLVIKVGLMKTILKHQILPSSATVHPPPLNPKGVLSIRATNSLPIIISPRKQL